MVSTFEFVDETVDRSTLEGYRDCPRQARFRQVKPVAPTAAMEVGNAVHDAFGAMVGLWHCGEFQSLKELVSHGEMALADSRPDLVKDASEAASRSLWPFAKWLERGKRGQVLRYDGGKGNYSGQLSKSYDRLGVTVSSELDLLSATDSPEVVDELDFKSGRTPYTATTIRDAFQFRLHALLVFENYPQVQELWCRVWLTRERRATSAAVFRRSELPEIETEVDAALHVYLQHAEQPPLESPAHPRSDRCSWCPYVVECGQVNVPEVETAEPASLVDRLAIIDAESAAIRKRLDPLVAASGDIATPLGNCYGTDKPTKPRAKSRSLYQVDVESDDDE